jgi:hypothetical protein
MAHPPEPSRPPARRRHRRRRTPVVPVAAGASVLRSGSIGVFGAWVAFFDDPILLGDDDQDG